MLRMIQEARGAFPKKMLRRAAFRSQHFDELSGAFEARQIDRLTGEPIKRLVTFEMVGGNAAQRDIGREMSKASGKMTEGEQRKLHQLKDLVCSVRLAIFVSPF